MYVTILPEYVSYLIEWLTAKINSNVRTFSVLARLLNPAALREVVITSVLNEDPPCVGVGGLCKIPLV